MKMKKMFFMLGLLTTLALCLAFTPAVSAAKRTDQLVLTNWPTDESALFDEGWAWDADTKTLTLSGLDLEHNSFYGAIELPGGSTITLTGNNNKIAGRYGIHCDGNLEIKGDGALTITTDPFSGITTENWQPPYTGGNRDVKVSGGTLDITANASGIFAHSRIIFSGGSGTLRSLNHYLGSAAEGAAGIEVDENSVTVTGSTDGVNYTIVPEIGKQKEDYGFEFLNPNTNPKGPLMYIKYAAPGVESTATLKVSFQGRADGSDANIENLTVKWIEGGKVTDTEPVTTDKDGTAKITLP